MNILFVTPFYRPQSGGVATYVQDMKRLLKSRGHNIYVLRPGESELIQACALANEDEVFELNLRVPWISTVPFRGIVAFCAYFIATSWKLLRFVRERKIQLISLEYPLSCMVYFYMVRLWTGIPILVSLHGSDILLLDGTDSVSQSIVRQVIRKADWVLAHSSNFLQAAKSKIGRLGKNLSYLHYGVECERLRIAADRETEAIDLPKARFILTVAKLYPRKGLDILLRAIYALKGIHCEYQFVIVGDGPEEPGLKELAKQLDIESMVSFWGDVKNTVVPALFKHCEFFVLSSRVEPFGIVLLEAMTFGKAVVATRAGGIPEFVQDGVNGLLVPTEDSQGLAEKINMLMRDKDFRDSMGRNGRVFVEGHYDYEKLVVTYEELFERLVTRR